MTIWNRNSVAQEPNFQSSNLLYLCQSKAPWLILGKAWEMNQCALRCLGYLIFNPFILGLQRSSVCLWIKCFLNKGGGKIFLLTFLNQLNNNFEWQSLERAQNHFLQKDQFFSLILFIVPNTVQDKQQEITSCWFFFTNTSCPLAPPWAYPCWPYI